MSTVECACVVYVWGWGVGGSADLCLVEGGAGVHRWDHLGWGVGGQCIKHVLWLLVWQARSAHLTHQS